jgi:signal transduction histidine kinase
MLHEFLIAERGKILSLCSNKILRATSPKNSSDKMEKGLPIFYDELIEVLRSDSTKDNPGESEDKAHANVHRASAISRGKESIRLGYNTSQVVHGYGAICQAITQYIQENGTQSISPREFNRLNFCLDTAISEAVAEYDRIQRENSEKEEIHRLGFLAHELRNALNNAVLAYMMIKTGKIGVDGSTAQILEGAHTRMRDLIDRSLAEVRLVGDPQLQKQFFPLTQLVSEVELTAKSDANDKSIEIRTEVT